MNDNAWERLTDAIDASLGIDRHGHTKDILEDNTKLTQDTEFFEFHKGDAVFRLERTTGPAIIDRKTHYSHRAGTANRMENIYDEHETAHRVTLFRQISGEWQEIKLSELSL